MLTKSGTEVGKGLWVFMPRAVSKERYNQSCILKRSTRLGGGLDVVKTIIVYPGKRGPDGEQR